MELAQLCPILLQVMLYSIFKLSSSQTSVAHHVNFGDISYPFPWCSLKRACTAPLQTARGRVNNSELRSLCLCLFCCPTRNWYLVGTHTAFETAVLTIERTVSRSPPVCGLSAPVPNAPDQARIRSARPGTLQRWSQRLHVLWYDPARGSGSHQAICRRHTRDLYAIWSQRPFSPPGERGMLPRHRGGRSRTKLITARP